MKIIKYIIAFFLLRYLLLLGIDLSELPENGEMILHSLAVQFFFLILIGFYLLVWLLIFRKRRNF